MQWKKGDADGKNEKYIYRYYSQSAIMYIVYTYVHCTSPYCAIEFENGAQKYDACLSTVHFSLVMFHPGGWDETMKSIF